MPAPMSPDSPRELIVGITGASGSAVAVTLLKALQRQKQVERVHVVTSDAALLVMAQELKLTKPDPSGLLERFLEGDRRFIAYRNDQLAAPISSGSHRAHGMVIVPCSMNTLAAIAAGLSNCLIHRAADVTLKERHPLLLAVRETPLSTIHLENMLRVSRNGAIVFPISPAFYALPESLDAVLENFVMRVLDHLGLEPDRGFRWGTPPPGG